MSEEYFKAALRDFTVDFAAGGAIRVMADKGYSVKKIKGRLDYPLTESTIGELVWKQFVKTGVILLKEPEDKGRYIACDFGKKIYQDRRAFETSLQDLTEDDRDYILGLPWPLATVWHIRNERTNKWNFITEDRTTKKDGLNEK